MRHICRFSSLSVAAAESYHLASATQNFDMVQTHIVNHAVHLQWCQPNMWASINTLLDLSLAGFRFYLTVQDDRPKRVCQQCVETKAALLGRAATSITIIFIMITIIIVAIIIVIELTC